MLLNDILIGLIIYFLGVISGMGIVHYLINKNKPKENGPKSNDTGETNAN